ncbi:MAG: NAD(P)-dependent oxidoreductase [Candidatus Woesearchaeota archaeon]|jgi:D-lactate dehydrogenase|nr:NAD(P)-dependent oxidoreductase [Candidatus Woesearchaeota archaeon]MDP7457205.1 NAD(P)-dependent oxidoreductase [Candidatus Woesearchaeota archaeon]
MKIGVFGAEQWDKSFFPKALKSDKLSITNKSLDEDSVKDFKDIEIACVFVGSKVTAKVIKSLPKLKFIATRSTGFDHVDLKAASKRKIKVANVPFYGENTVAEHAFALLLNLSKNVHKSYIKTLADDYSWDGLMGFDLKGKTLGVLGAGHIGMHLIRMARGFGMNVLAYDLFRNDFLADILSFEYSDDIEYVLKRADIVSLHMPSLSSTKHIINKKRISLMKRGAIIINTARGDLIDTNALYAALKSGHLGGAGLDVIEGEDLIKEEPEKLNKESRARLRLLHKDHKIFHLPNVVFTPHIAFFSKEALERIMQTTVDNIAAFKAGKDSGNEVSAK